MIHLLQRLPGLLAVAGRTFAPAHINMPGRLRFAVAADAVYRLCVSVQGGRESRPTFSIVTIRTLTVKVVGGLPAAVTGDAVRRLCQGVISLCASECARVMTKCALNLKVVLRTPGKMARKTI